MLPGLNKLQAYFGKANPLVVFGFVLLLSISAVATTLYFINPNSQDSSAASFIQVSGTVKDASGNGVDGATVSISGGLTGSTTSSGGGSFNIKVSYTQALRTSVITIKATHAQLGTTQITKTISTSSTTISANLNFSQNLASGSDSIFMEWKQKTVNSKTIEQYLEVVKTIPTLSATYTNNGSNSSLYVYITATNKPVASMVIIPSTKAD